MRSRDFKKHPVEDFKPLARMTREEARAEVEALRAGIDYHDELYYVKNKPEISDALYDKLFHRLESLEQKFPRLRPDISDPSCGRKATKGPGARCACRTDAEFACGCQRSGSRPVSRDGQARLRPSSCSILSRAEVRWRFNRRARRLFLPEHW
jgi:hypothetical protein